MHKTTYHRHKPGIVALLTTIATLIPVSCTQTDEPDGGTPTAPDKGIVTFGAYISSTTASRSSVSNIHTLKKSGFGVFASITGTDDFQDDPVSGDFTPNAMYNQKVAWQGVTDSDSSWVYEPEILWPGVQKMSFFAYSPYTDKPNTTIKGWSGINDSGSPRITFSLGKTTDAQVDLLYANALNLINSPQVTFNFKHALSRISIQLTTDSDIDSNSTLSVNKLSFKSTDLGTSGELNLGTGIWTKIEGTTELVFTTADAIKKGFMVIPPEEVATLEITADYTLTTNDSNLTNGSFKIDRVVSSPFSLKFEAGKSYNLNLRLSLHSVEVSASISDWDDENHIWDSDQDRYHNEIE